MAVFYVKFFFLLFIFNICFCERDKESKKTPCEGCRDLVDGVIKVSRLLVLV